MTLQLRLVLVAAVAASAAAVGDPATAGTYYWDGMCKPCPSSLYDHCANGGELVGERGCGFLSLFCEGHCRVAAHVTPPKEADWIVVGAGASGCAAAAALADAGAEVVVLERGQNDRDNSQKDTQQASTWPAVVNTDAAQKIQWQDGVWGAVANVLGGGTSVNGGLYIEEEPEFLQQTFGESFDLDAFYASSAYLSKNLTEPLAPSQFGHDFARALADANLGSKDPQPSVRMKDGSWVAHSTINTTQADWPRRGASVLLHERAHLPNLKVLTEFQVTRVLVEGQKATGVRVETSSGGDVSIVARKGVIMAAGAIFTPQLLQISGIGDEQLLARLGVTPVVKNSAVGANFIDRNVLPMGVWTHGKEPLYTGWAMAVNKSLGLTIESEGWGEVTSEFALSSLALVPPDQRSSVLRSTLDLLFKTGIANIMNNMIQLVSLQHNTRSRGTVEAVSANAKTAPKVNANFFSDERDLEEQLTSMRTLQRLLNTEQVQKYVFPGEDFVPAGIPLPSYLTCMTKRPGHDQKAIVLPCMPETGSSNERYYEYFRNTRVSSYHYFGTAAFGSVVEGADFHVKGVDNLHVVDASIFPHPTQVNPQGTIMAMGHYIGTKLGKAQRRLAEPHMMV